MHLFFSTTIDPILSVSDFIRQHTAPTTLGSPDAGWVILSSAESRIRHKIEEAGKPLKDWDVRINYGIKTGYNDAFIIDGVTKDELIRRDPKSAEIIRPVLRGRDIKRYRAEFADKWLINTHNGLRDAGIERINAERDYPAVFEYLNQAKFKPTIEAREDRGQHWTNLRNCAYLPDMENDKVVWLEITDIPKFCFDDGRFFVEATAFFMVGRHSHYLLSVLNSKISQWYLDKISASTGAGTNRWKKVYLEKIPLPEISDAEATRFKILAQELIANSKTRHSITDIEFEVVRLLSQKYDLTLDEQSYLLKSAQPL